MANQSVLSVIRRRWLIVFLALAVGGVLGVGASLLIPKRYESSVSFFVSTTATGNAGADNGQFVQGRIASYIQVLESERLAQRVASNTRQPREDVVGHISATTQAETVVITATTSADSAQLAERMGRAVATVFPLVVDQLDNQGQKGAGVTISVIAGPVAPTTAAFPIWWQVTGIGLLAGLLAGLVIATIAELTNSRIRSLGEVESMVRAPVLAVLPGRGPRPAMSDPQSAAAERFRQLRVAVELRTGDNGPRVVGLAPVEQSDSHAAAAVDLAAVYAEHGERALLIELNSSRPAVARLCGVQPNTSLNDVVSGRTSLSEATERSALGGFDIVVGRGGADAQDSRPADIAPGSRPGDPLAGVLQTARADYDRVVVLTNPLPGDADALIAGAASDALLIVATVDQSDRRALADTVRVTEAGRLPLVGALVGMGRRADRS